MPESLSVGAPQLGKSTHHRVLKENLKRCDEALKSLQANIETIHAAIGKLLARLQTDESVT